MVEGSRSERETPLPLREWVVYRELTTRQVFTGIKARTHEEALAEWHRGHGELNVERTRQLDPRLDAVDVKEC